MSERRRFIMMIIVTLAVMSALWVLVTLALRGVSIPCFFYKLTGFLCPGCGNSRAGLALLCGDFALAFQYNIMFLPEVFYIAWVYMVCACRYVKGKGFSYYSPPLPALDIIFLMLFVAWGILRNIF